MKPFRPVEIQKMAFCQQLNELKSIFDVCEKNISLAGADELRSVVDVLANTNNCLKRYVTAESKYLSDLEDNPVDNLPRSAKEAAERLAELYLIHSHYDVCSTVVSELGTDELVSLSEVFSGAANRLYCLYDEQSKLGGDV